MIVEEKDDLRYVGFEANVPECSENLEFYSRIGSKYKFERHLCRTELKL